MNFVVFTDESGVAVCAVGVHIHQSDHVPKRASRSLPPSKPPPASWVSGVFAGFWSGEASSSKLLGVTNEVFGVSRNRTGPCHRPGRR